MGSYKMFGGKVIFLLIVAQVTSVLMDPSGFFKVFKNFEYNLPNNNKASPVINYQNYQDRKNTRRQNLSGSKSARLVFEVHPEEYLEEAYRKGSSYNIDKVKTFSNSPDDYVVKDSFNIDLKTGSYTVNY